MIEVDYNEYKETIAENMRLIRINHDLNEIIKEAREYIKETYTKKGTEAYRIHILLILEKADKDNK